MNMKIVITAIIIASAFSGQVCAADPSLLSPAQIVDQRWPLISELPVPTLDAATVTSSSTTTVHVGQTRAQKRSAKYEWYALSDSQYAKLVAALKTIPPLAKPVLVLSATADSLALAEDFDEALGDAGIKSSIDRPMDVVDGLHCTYSELCDLVDAATNIHSVRDPDEGDSYVLNFGRKAKQ
jgi:hypothetical protein